MLEQLKNNNVAENNPVVILSLFNNDAINTIDLVLNGILSEDVKSYYDLSEIKKHQNVLKNDRLKDDAIKVIGEIFKESAKKYLLDVVKVIEDNDSKIADNIKSFMVELSNDDTLDAKLTKIETDPVLIERAKGKLKSFIINLMVKNNVDDTIEQNDIDKAVKEHLNTIMVAKSDPTAIRSVLSIPNSFSEAVSKMSEVFKKDPSVIDIIINNVNQYYGAKEKELIESINKIDLIDSILEVNIDDDIGTIKLMRKLLNNTDENMEAAIGLLNDYKTIDVLSTVRSLYSSIEDSQALVSGALESDIQLKYIDVLFTLSLKIKNLEIMLINRIIENLKIAESEYNAIFEVYSFFINRISV